MSGVRLLAVNGVYMAELLRQDRRIFKGCGLGSVCSVRGEVTGAEVVGLVALVFMFFFWYMVGCGT